MGLEMVEIIMDVEKTFGISLPDARASEIRTVSDLCDCMEDIFGCENAGGRLMGATTVRLHQAVQSAAPKKASQQTITADTFLSSLFPLFGRRRAWRRLAKALDMPLPPLERPHLISTIMLVVAIVLGHISGMLTLTSIIPPKTTYSGWLIGILGVLFAFTAIYLWWLVGHILTLPLAVLWPKAIRTIGGLSEDLLEKTYGEVVKKEQRFNHEEVWCILQSIVASTLGVNRCDVKPESRFVEDLGAG